MKLLIVENHNRPCALREVSLGHVFGGRDLGLDARDVLASGAQLTVSLGDVGGEKATILRLLKHE